MRRIGSACVRAHLACVVWVGHVCRHALGLGGRMCVQALELGACACVRVEWACVGGVRAHACWTRDISRNRNWTRCEEQGRVEMARTCGSQDAQMP